MKCVTQISCLLAAIACLTAELANAADNHEKGAYVVGIVICCDLMVSAPEKINKLWSHCMFLLNYPPAATPFGQRSPRGDQYYGYQQQQTSYNRCPPTYELQIVYQAGGRYYACGCPAGTFQAWVGYGRAACVPNAQATGKQLTRPGAAKPTTGQAGDSVKNSKVIMSEMPSLASPEEVLTDEEQAPASQAPQNDAELPDDAAVAESRMLSEDSQQVAPLSVDPSQVASEGVPEETRENKGAMVAVAVLSCIAFVMLIVVVIGSVLVVRRKRVYTVGGLPPHIRQAPTYHKYPEPLQYFHDEDLVCPESPMYSPHTVV